MTDWTLPLEGGCRCGALRFRVGAPPMISSVCHCRGCQRMTGSAFAATLTAPSTEFEVTAGEPVIGGLRSPEVRHHHCDACKSWVFTRVEPDQGFVNIRTTQLDDPRPFPPFLEVYTGEKLPWAETGAVRSYPQFPPMSDYPGLLKDYAAFAEAPRTGANP